MNANLIEIVCRAATVAERCGEAFIPEPAGCSGDDLNRRLEQWCRSVADGDWSLFERRLSLDRFTIETARRALLPVRLAPNVALPGWAETLAEVLSPAEQGCNAAADRFLQSGTPLPFEDVCLPFVRVAQRKLVNCSGTAYHRLSHSAHAALERQLLARLSGISAQAFYLEFSIVRGHGRSGFARYLSSAPQSRELYIEFVQELLGGKLLEFFREYSVLARQMATAVEFWVEATAELLLRLENDYATLATEFASGKELGPVTEIRPSLSDPHDRGRSVTLLTWESGLKLLYKPRDLALERGYNVLLAWLNARRASLHLRVCGVLERAGYGWMEFVEHLACRTSEDAEDYFRRAGMHLCLLYALRGSDFHDENIIASGSQPIPVDLEVLLQPRLRDSFLGLDRPDDPAHEELGESVLGTGMLPWWLIMPDGRTWNFTALGAAEKCESIYPAPRWQNVNSDAMELTHEHTMLPHANVARLNDEPLSPAHFEKQLVDGFEFMYRLLLEHREALLSHAGPLSRFAHVRIRFVLRATYLYAWYMRTRLRPQFLRDGVVGSILIDALSRQLLAMPALWPLLAIETQSLENMDIPSFATRSDCDSMLLDDHRAIEHCFVEPSYELIVKRIRRMSREDLAWQIQMIRGALRAYEADGAADASVHDIVASDSDAVTMFTPGEAVRQALALAQALQRHALRSEFSGASWIGLVPIPRTRRVQLQPVWYGLYDGACGIALFLAALEKVTDGAGYRDLCLQALQPFRTALRARSDGIPPYISPHGELGFVIYGLTRISKLVNEPSLCEDAQRLARFLTPERIAADRDFDIISGSAGVILGLLALYEATSDEDLIRRAVNCGRHLLEHRVASRNGSRSWPNIDNHLLAGFSHGAAGIAYSLLLLGRVADDSTFTDAALEAIAYEQSLFDSHEGNWPRLGALENGQRFPCAWCHGAPGIGLARVASLPIADSRAIRADIDAAVNTTVRAGLQGVDDLCCGNFGRLDFLLSAGQALGRQELVESAQRQAADVIARATARGRYALRRGGGDRSGDLSPGLFQGEAGIGYELLRLAYPQQIPSVLAFQ